MNTNVLLNGGVNVNGALELLGDMETYNDTLKDFISEIDEKLAKIKEYKEAGDMANYAILVHSLKSDSKYLGFTSLAEIAYNHEMASKENNSIFVNSNYDNLIKETNRIVALVKMYLGDDNLAKNNFFPAKSNAKKILVVDDSNIVRSFVMKILPDEYTILTAIDGDEAIQIITENTDTLKGVLLDINMPKVDGFQVLEYFKNNGLFSEIPVAIITGDDSRDTILKAFDYPIIDVLNKPFTETAVTNVVTKMINFGGK